MLFITSPAKTLDWQSDFQLSFKPTQPALLKESTKVMGIMSKLDASGLRKLMHISQAIAELNLERNKLWQPEHNNKNSRPALHAFNGDIFKQMTPRTYTKDQQDYAQQCVRIISGLYGVLRAYDLIQPYRLEMGSKLDVDGKQLYKFWQPHTTKLLADEAKSAGHKFLVNLASNEYSSAVSFKDLPIPVIDIEFREKRNGKLQNVAIYSKQARGMMLEFCVKHLAADPQDMEKFDTAGYKLVAKTAKSLTFAR